MLNIEEEGDDVTVLDDIFFPFQVQLPLLTGFGQAAAGYQAVEMNPFGANESFFHVGMYFSGGFYRRCTAFYRPGSHLVGGGGEKGYKVG